MGAVDSARACGAEAAQIWASNPRGWAHPNVPPDLAAAFGQAWAAARIGPLFLHAPYMVNVASPNPEFRARSVELARATVALADQVGAAGVVIHAGAGGAGTPRSVALGRAVDSLSMVADAAASTMVLIELTAGGAGSVAATFGQAAELLHAAGRHRRLGLCADTCHLFASGYALESPEGVTACFDEVRRLGLVRRLLLIHANDSKFPRGGHRDAHVHIGDGHIGLEGFSAILANPVVRQVPLVCETPGRLEDHARNISVLRGLADDRPGTRP
jgi:deoxyribonuclease-4